MLPLVRLLTAPEVADVLAVSEREVLSVAASGALLSVRVGGARRFEATDVRAFIDAQKGSQ